MTINLPLPPVVAALRKRKVGVALIVLQIALTLAMVSNAMFIIGQRIDKTRRATGIHEADLLLVDQTWAAPPPVNDPARLDKLDAMQRADMDALRALPGVVSVAAVNGLPLFDDGSFYGIGLTPLQRKNTTAAAFYFGDAQMIDTLGLRLVEGRAFRADEILHRPAGDPQNPSIAIVSRALAEKLFPGQEALGKSFYMRRGGTPVTVVGIVDRLQIQFLHQYGEKYTWDSVLVPIRWADPRSLYAVRTQPGQLDKVRKTILPALAAISPMRLLTPKSVQSFADIRAAAYRAERGTATVLGIICVILLAVTVAGIVGLTSFWIRQRYAQIGIRRALGARQADILGYFLIENLWISGTGVVLGVSLAIILNRGLMDYYEVERIPSGYVLTGALIVLLLSLAAVLAPARRASQVPPIVMARAL